MVSHILNLFFGIFGLVSVFAGSVMIQNIITDRLFSNTLKVIKSVFATIIIICGLALIWVTSPNYVHTSECNCDSNIGIVE